MENKYQWKIKSFSKNVDPDLALAEIERAENLYGKITAETVLNVAKDEDSSIHSLFEWRDDVAAEKYRLAQARTIINNIEVVVISSSNQTVTIPVYEIVKDGGMQYRHIDVMTTDERSFVVSSTIRQINQLRQKLNIYNDFGKVISHLNSAVMELELFEENEL